MTSWYKIITIKNIYIFVNEMFMKYFLLILQIIFAFYSDMFYDLGNINNETKEYRMCKKDKLRATPKKAEGSIYSALCKAQSEFITIEKRRQGYNFKYADLADIWDMIRVPLTSNGLSLVQLIDSEDGSNYVITRLYHTSGDVISSRTLIEFTAKKFQEVGTAHTYYRRYALSAMLGIVSDEDVDDKLEKQEEIYKKQVVVSNTYSNKLLISQEQIRYIEELIKPHPDIKSRLLTSFGALHNIQLIDYDKIMTTVHKLIKDKEVKNGNSN